MKAEIITHSQDFGFGANEYQTIFVNGTKTNFWRYSKEEGLNGFFINKSEEELKTYCDLINQGKIKPWDDKLESFDICSHLEWIPKKVSVIEYTKGMSLPPNKQMLSGLNCYEKPAPEYLLKTADKKWFLQYCNIVDLTTKSVLENMLIVIYPYGATFYAVK